MQNDPGTLHGRTSDVYQRLRKLDSRLNQVTISICGHSPEVAGQTPKPMEEYLHDKFDAIARVLTTLEEEMARLENSVGANVVLNQKSPAVGY